MTDSIAPPDAPRVALIGFGEAGQTFAAAGRWDGRASGWDILRPRRAAMAEFGVEAAARPEEAIFGAAIVLSLVTADAALAAARDYAWALDPGTIWCDMNSVAPETKRLAAEAVCQGDGRYVDAAIMAPVEPARLRAPVLLAGEASGDAARLLSGLGFADLRPIGAEIGQASAIKMIRSVMVKGMEALSYECAAAAEAAGVLDEVLASLDASDKPLGWAERIAYSRERMETHGLRRAAEMEESAKTLQGLGIEPVMTRGTVVLQRRAAQAKTDKGTKAA